MAVLVRKGQKPLEHGETKSDIPGPTQEKRQKNEHTSATTRSGGLRRGNSPEIRAGSTVCSEHCAGTLPLSPLPAPVSPGSSSVPEPSSSQCPEDGAQQSWEGAGLVPWPRGGRCQ